MVAVNDNWQKDAEKLPVNVKKEFFFRAMLPMVAYENHQILTERARLITIHEMVSKGQPMKDEDLAFLNKLAGYYGLPDALRQNGKNACPVSRPFMEQLLRRVDIVPPSLAISQAACESGYGTSRFSLKGNALFGEWTYGNKGLKAKAPRNEKGKYRVRKFEWPFDSLRSYVNNLNTGHHYKNFRAKRDLLRKENRPITGLALAGALEGYSERGAEYVKDIKNFIQKNHLDGFDSARLRNDRLTLVVYVNTEADEVLIKKEIQKMRVSGELEREVESMKLDN